jgi:hypothetical protein
MIFSLITFSIMRKIIVFITVVFMAFSLFSAVEFLEFNAELQGLNILLSWSTATETANLGFILERKTASMAPWESLANYMNDDALLGQGTVSTQSNYTYTDSLVTNDETYFYRISGIDYANNIGLLDSLSIMVGEVGIRPVVPSDFILTAYPNPFNPRAVISMHYAMGRNTVLNIYNIHGILVDQLINGFVESGTHEMIWDASNMPSGVYIVKMQAGEYLHSRKIILMK